jgi:hypothetical protein
MPAATYLTHWPIFQPFRFFSIKRDDVSENMAFLDGCVTGRKVPAMNNIVICLLNIACAVNDPAAQTPCAIAIHTLFCLMRGVARLASNPAVARHVLLAAIYAVAALSSRRAGHSEPSITYAKLAFLHALLGVLAAGHHE